MAKGLRSSTKKANRAKAKANVFGPVEAARNERLSAKLLELAQQPKPARNEMEVENEDLNKEGGNAEDHVDEDAEAMDVDGAAKARQPLSKTALKKRRSGKIQKKVRKPRNVIAFPKRGGTNDKLSMSKKRRL